MVEAFRPVKLRTIVLSIALVTAFGVPETSKLPVAKAGSVPQIKELRVLLAPPFITVRNCAPVVVIEAVLFDLITGIKTKTLERTGVRVIPEALLASNA